MLEVMQRLAAAPAESLDTESALAQIMLENLGVAVALIDRSGALSLINAPCHKLLTRADGVAAIDGRLVGVSEHDHRKLELTLAQAFLNGEAATVAIHGCTSSGVYSVCFLPAGASTTHRIVVVIDGIATHRANDTWRSLFDLSDREIQLAKQILSRATRH